MPRPNSSLARQWGNITMSHPGNTPGQHPGAAAEQYPGAASSQPRPTPDPPPLRIGPTTTQHRIRFNPRSASSPQHPSAVSGDLPGAQKQKSVRIATFLRLAIVANSPIANRGTKTQQKWHISRLKEPRRAPNRKKVAKIPSFLFLQWVRSPQSGSSHENARSIMTSNPKSETSKAPAMRTPPEKPIWLESTLPWHHTARNKHRAQPSAYHRSPLRPELHGCTGAR